MKKPSLDNSRRTQIETTIDYRFDRSELLDRALTHASAVPGRAVALSNERLEFLGDRVLGLVVASHVMASEGDSEGVLSERLNALVNRCACINAARTAGLARVLMTGPSLRGDSPGFDSALADAMEAMIGAVYLDGGYEAACAVVHRIWKAALVESKTVARDPKTALQESVQARGLPVPTYSTLQVTGPPHAPVFEVEVDIEGLGVKAVGQGSSKQNAERAAASTLLERMSDT